MKISQEQTFADVLWKILLQKLKRKHLHWSQLVKNLQPYNLHFYKKRLWHHYFFSKFCKTICFFAEHPPMSASEHLLIYLHGIQEQRFRFGPKKFLSCLFTFAIFNILTDVYVLLQKESFFFVRNLNLDFKLQAKVKAKIIELFKKKWNKMQPNQSLSKM